MPLEVLTPEDGCCVLLIRTYEKCRQEAGQSGYRCLIQDGASIEVSPKILNTFKTVLKFMQGEGFVISWREAAWIGYVKYVFKSLSPTIPQPGQLKNKLLLRKYLSDFTLTADIAPVRTDEEMEQIYLKVLRKEVVNDQYLRALLGLRRV